MLSEIFYSVLMLLAGLGAFLYGLHIFTTYCKNCKQAFKNAFNRIGDNRFVNFGIGAGTTVAIQSSTATTVTIVGLVSAGVMTLKQAVPAIIGANVGSALSDMLLSLSAFRIRYFFMAFVFIGVVGKVFSKKQNWFCRISDLLISFGIIFIGLYLMRGAFPADGALTNAFQRLFSIVTFPLLLVLLGFVLTAIIQSSSASVGIYIAMAYSGIFGIETVLYLVIGSSLGTTLTMIIASIPASREAKRAAAVHLFHNIIATLIFVPIVWLGGGFLLPYFTSLVPNIVWQISIFSAIINVTTALLLICFTPQITRFVTWLIKDKPAPSEEEDAPVS